MIHIRKVFYCSWMFLSLSMVAQKKEILYSNFCGLTNDVFVRDSIEYMCSISPLSHFEHYETVFGNLSMDTSDPESPVITEKNYKAKWRLFDKTLYLSEIEIIEGPENNSEKYKTIEKLTSRSFDKHMSKVPHEAENFPNGGLYASWFSGFLYLKRQPTTDECYCDCMYRCERYKMLVFYRGELIYEREVDQMLLYIDSLEITNNKRKYQGIIDGFDPCISPLRDSLQEGEHFRDYFFGHTNDEIQWKDTLRMLSESPLSFFDNYEIIYASDIDHGHPMFEPYFQEKNYSAKWIILDDKLYLYDIVFGSQKAKEDVIGDSSLKVVEKLISKKFTKIKSFDQKVIFASWYSGTLYFKRKQEKRKYTESDCEYSCRPMTKITVEKGKITSMEPTFYMIQKR